MDAKQRRDQMMNLLQMDLKPVSANTLAERFEVSRQVIVGDIALLRAGGAEIIATPRGYMLARKNEPGEDDAGSYVIACRHDKGSLEAELYAIVDNGGTLVNVTVDHPLYGSITQPLHIRSRYDADSFLAKVAVTGATLLSTLSDGVHLHGIRCPDAESYRRILVALREHGILYTK